MPAFIPASARKEVCQATKPPASRVPAALLRARGDAMPDEIKCADCGKAFPMADALEQHRKAKHTAEPPPAAAPTIRKSHAIYAALFVAVIVSGYYLYSVYSALGQYDDFAKCISGSGAKFYGAFWCPHCANQKAMFGPSVKYLPYVECSTPDRSGQTQVCISAKIDSYPTWEFRNGTRLMGEISLQDLATASGCSL